MKKFIVVNMFSGKSIIEFFSIDCFVAWCLDNLIDGSFGYFFLKEDPSVIVYFETVEV